MTAERLTEWVRITVVVDVEVVDPEIARTIARAATVKLCDSVRQWSQATDVRPVRYELDGDPTLVEWAGAR